MTFAEIERAAECWQRKQRRELQEKARLTHILADLVGHSVARIYSQNAKMPTLQEAFPTLFEETEKEKEQKAAATMEISALRFMQFATAHNKKKGGANGN
jgi:C4-type Zn-finger protein